MLLKAGKIVLTRGYRRSHALPLQSELARLFGVRQWSIGLVLRAGSRCAVERDLSIKALRMSSCVDLSLKVTQSTIDEKVLFR